MLGCVVMPPLALARTLRRAFRLHLGLSLLAVGLVPSAAFAEVEPLRVLMIGDSITAGVRVTSSQSYPGLLAEWLGADYEIVERGCSSTTTSMWLPPDGSSPTGGVWCRNQQPASIYGAFAQAELPADIVTVMLGTNDALFTWISDQDYASNLEEIVAALLDEGAGTVVLMTPPDHPDPQDWQGPYRLRLLGTRVRMICESMPGVVCGPDVYELLSDPSYFSRVAGEFNVHPNAAGHALIAEHLHDLIVELSPAPACEDESRPRSLRGMCTAYCRWLDCDSIDHAGAPNLCGHLERKIRDRSGSTWLLCGEDSGWPGRGFPRSWHRPGEGMRWRFAPRGRFRNPPPE